MEHDMEEHRRAILIIRGTAAILFGIAAVFWPGITLVTLVYLFSAYLLASGIVGLIAGLAFSQDTATSRLLTTIVSIVEIGVGIYLLRHPLVTFATLILLIGFTLIVRGVIDIVGGLFVEGGATRKLFTILTGILAGLAGIIVLFQPASSGVAFVWILGLYAIISGPLLIAIALEDRDVTGRRIKV